MAAARDTLRDHTEIALCYVEDVLSGEQVAGRLIRRACERQLRDLERAAAGDPDFPNRFDAERANRVCRFIEALPHIKGEWAKRKELLTLEPWQIFGETTLFGWVHVETGRRRFKSSYEEVARKNAKSTRAAARGLYLLLADGEVGPEVYCAATKKDQAALVFGTMRNMVRRSAGLRNRFGVIAHNYRLEVPSVDGESKALDAKGSTQDGLNPHGVINDELHAWKGRALYDVLDTAMGARAQPLMCNITTAGYDRAGICFEQHAYAVRVLEGKVADESVFAAIYTLDPDDDWTDEKVWEKANPNLGVSVYLEDLRGQARQAKAVASKVNTFLTKRLDVWCSAATAWMDMRAWDACGDPGLRLADFAGADAIAALDLAVKKDICSRILWIERDGIYHLFARHYCPRDAIESGENASYAGWERDGWLQASEGAVIDQDAVKDDLLADAKIVSLAEIVFDPYQAAKFMGELEKLDFEVVELGATVRAFSAPMYKLEELALTGRLRHQADPVLDWMVGNVTARRDEKDNIYPRKETKDSPLKIDGAVAAIMGLNRLMADEDDGTEIVIGADYSLVPSADKPEPEGAPA